MKRFTDAMLLGTLVSFVLLAWVSAAQTCPPGEDSRETELIWLARKEPDGLHKAALQNNGRFTIHERFNAGYIAYTDVSNLIHDSDVVLLGTATERISELNKRGNSISTNYKFDVQRVLAGKAPSVLPITVRIPGGTVTYPDGSTATVSFDNYRHIEPGSTYILFLKVVSQDDVQTCIPVGGPSGIYGIVDGEVVPYAKPPSPVASKYMKRSEASFIEEITADDKGQDKPQI